jgi:hypothetical protein
VARAREIEERLKRIEALVQTGSSLNAAFAKEGGEATKAKRASLWRWLQRYRESGFEGLIDARTPRRRELTVECGKTIEALREANPELTAKAAEELLERQGMTPVPSLASIKKVFRRVDDRRARSMAREQEGKTQVTSLPLAGGELLLAAEIETGVMAALTDEVVAIGKEAKEAAGDREPERDTENRNRKGQFTARYNRIRRRKPGEKIAGYLRSSAEKAKGRVPSWPRFVQEARRTIAPKIGTLVLSWGIAETKGWDALRAPYMAGLAPLTGLAYMPSTLAKLTSALAMAEAGDRFLAATGVRWHQVARERWGERGAIAALYVDNHAKEVWSSLYTMSGKVSHLSRVMPCITSTYVHTGAGAPIVASVQSGSAPLAPRLQALVERTEKMLEENIRRAVVIDAEGSTFDVLESFVKNNEDEKKSRILVTPLRPSRAPELDICHGPGSYYRPYRENDELRIGKATLTHKTTGRTLEVGTLEVRREHRESDTILLTNGLELGATGKDLADLYFERWPIQENFFKDGGAVGIAEHRTNRAEIVVNVAVESKLEKLGRQQQAAEARLVDLEKNRESHQTGACRAAEELEEATNELNVRRERLDELVAKGMRDGKDLGQAAVSHHVALARTEAATIANRKAQAKKEKLEAQIEKLAANRERIQKEQTKLRPLEQIRQLDVEPDKILTATKLALMLLTTFALREYLPCLPMVPRTFFTRAMHLQGRREVNKKDETVVFYENPRDPEITGALRSACESLNKRRLQRDGRTLHYRVEVAPADGIGAGRPT